MAEAFFGNEYEGLSESAMIAFRAAEDGDLATLKRFLGSVDMNTRNGSGYTLLHVACLSSDRFVVAELLRAGADPCLARWRVTSAQRVWPLLLSNGGVSNKNPMASVMDEDGFEYIRTIVKAGGFAAQVKAHRTRLVATLVSKFTRIPADNIPLVVDFWAHVGFY